MEIEKLLEKVFWTFRDADGGCPVCVSNQFKYFSCICPEYKEAIKEAYSKWFQEQYDEPYTGAMFEEV